MSESNILWRIGHYMNPKRIDKKMVKLWAFWIVFNLILFANPQKHGRWNDFDLSTACRLICLCISDEGCDAKPFARNIFNVHIMA